MGVLISTAAVFSSSIASNASKSIWKSFVRGGTTFRFRPAPSTYGLYSGKNGAKVIISCPGTATQRMAWASAPAAPVAIKICSIP